MLVEEGVASGLVYCKDVGDMWLVAVDRPEPHIKDMVKRSWLNTAAGNHLFEHLSYVGYQHVPPEVGRCLKATFGLGQTRLQEQTLLWPAPGRGQRAKEEGHKGIAQVVESSLAEISNT